MIEFFEYLYDGFGHLYSWLFIVVTIGLTIRAVFVLFVVRTRWATRNYLMWTLLPLVIGVIGTVHGYLSVRSLSGVVPAENLAYHYGICRMTTYCGAVLTGFFFMLGWFAYSRVRDVAPQGYEETVYPASIAADETTSDGSRNPFESPASDTTRDTPLES